MYNEFMKDLNNPEGYIERRQRDFLRRYEEHKKELDILIEKLSVVLSDKYCVAPVGLAAHISIAKST